MMFIFLISNFLPTYTLLVSVYMVKLMNDYSEPKLKRTLPPSSAGQFGSVINGCLKAQTMNLWEVRKCLWTRRFFSLNGPTKHVPRSLVISLQRQHLSSMDTKNRSRTLEMPHLSLSLHVVYQKHGDKALQREFLPQISSVGGWGGQETSSPLVFSECQMFPQHCTIHKERHGPCPMGLLSK